MKTFTEFMLIAEVAEIPMTPEQIAASRARRAAAAQRLAQNAGTPGEKAAAEAAAKRMGRNTRVPGEDIRGTGRAQATPPKSSAIVKPGSSALSTDVRQPIKNAKVPGRKIPGLKGGSVLSGVIDTALEKQSGSGWRRSLAKGATTALGTAAGAALGSAVAPGAGTFVGGAAGAAAAGKAFDTVAGANAKDRAAMRQQKRQSQSGGALVGTGGKTTFDTKKHTMTTGTGPNQKTIRLTKLSAVKDPKSGNLETGHLAYKGGKAVYKRADTSNATLAKTSSNPWERFGRTINPNAYKASDEAARKAKLQKAIASDNLRNRDLGINKNKVGAKVVGQKIVGPAKVGPKK